MNMRRDNNVRRESTTYDWQHDENISQINIVPANRILEVKELDMKFENMSREGTGDKSQWGSASHTAVSANTVL